MFPYCFRETVISIQNFTLLRYRKVLCTILRPASGAPSSAPGQKFPVFVFSPWFHGLAKIGMPNFMLLQYRELLQTIFRPASGAPGSAPGLKLLTFPFVSR